MNRYAALIPAAGFSSRMGALKPLMPLCGKSVLETTVACFIDAGLTDIIVVLGHEAERIRDSFHGAHPVRFVYNEQYHSGMFTSIQAGTAAMDRETTAFLMMPADCPMVRPETVKKIIRAHEMPGASIVRPTFSGKGGHPTLFSMRYREEIMEGDFPQGMRSLMQKHQEEVLSLPVDDEAILWDMDTPAQYAALRKQIDTTKDTST